MTEGRRTRKANRAAFGSVRKLPSGRFQVRYPDEAGVPMSAPHTFATKAEANRFLAAVQADRTRGAYIDHRKGDRLFGEFGTEYIDNGGTRGRLAIKTEHTYRELLADPLASLHLMPLNAMTPDTIERWHRATRKRLSESAAKRGMTGETKLAQAYRLLHSILNHAVRKGLIMRNPCMIVGAGTSHAPERPFIENPQFAAILDVLREQYRLPILVAYGAHLRIGEVVGLVRRDFDPARGTLRIERQKVEVGGREVMTGTKTGVAADMALPAGLASLLADHLASTPGSPDSPMFTKANGDALKRNAIQTNWRKARVALGLPPVHIHDMRHKGLTEVAMVSTPRETQARGRHKTARAAMIYQHVAEGRMTRAAEHLDTVLVDVLASGYGTRMARQPLEVGSAEVVELGELVG